MRSEHRQNVLVNVTGKRINITWLIIVDEVVPLYFWPRRKCVILLLLQIPDCMIYCLALFTVSCQVQNAGLNYNEAQELIIIENLKHKNQVEIPHNHCFHHSRLT